MRASITRRAWVGGALALPAVLRRPAGAAQFTFKAGMNTPPTHPIAVHAVNAAARVKEATGGRVEI